MSPPSKALIVPHRAVEHHCRRHRAHEGSSKVPGPPWRCLGSGQRPRASVRCRSFSRAHPLAVFVAAESSLFTGPACRPRVLALVLPVEPADMRRRLPHPRLLPQDPARTADYELERVLQLLRFPRSVRTSSLSRSLALCSLSLEDDLTLICWTTGLSSSCLWPQSLSASRRPRTSAVGPLSHPSLAPELIESIPVLHPSALAPIIIGFVLFVATIVYFLKTKKKGILPRRIFLVRPSNLSSAREVGELSGERCPSPSYQNRTTVLCLIMSYLQAFSFLSTTFYLPVSASRVPCMRSRLQALRRSLTGPSLARSSSKESRGPTL